MNNPIFADLNPRQKEAVEVLSGPLLILAGAGSGKTKCLTHRIANLMANGIPGNQILAVTFTNKAANEMKSRVEKLLASLHAEQQEAFSRLPMVGTFHSICVRILREDIERVDCGITKNFVIFDADDSKNLLKLVLKELRYDEKEIKHKAVAAHISSAKNRLLTPMTYFEQVEDNRFTKAVKEAYPLYQTKLREHNALDFDDLLQKTVELLEQSPETLTKYRKRWQHVLVDEYQDTNFAQYRLVRLLADEHQNLCVIGDDHQSIYSFRGADYTNILNFEKDFPATKTIKLEQNYRSTGNILNNANSLISFNETGEEKNLWTEKHEGDPMVVTEVYNEREEGNHIAQHIESFVNQGAASYSDFAILYRMNAQSRALEEAFMRSQIPYQIVGGTRFFDRREIKDVIAYLRLIFNPKDDVAFLRIINVPSRKIGAATLETVKEFSDQYDMSLFEILANIDEVRGLAESKKEVLKDFRQLIIDLQETAKKEPISIVLDRLIEAINFYKWLDDGTMEGEARIQNVRELFSVAGRYDGSEDSLAAFLEGVALISDLDNYDTQADSVTMMTIHAAKGLEFPVVFLPGWEDGIFPSSSAQFSFEQLEEERRLGYVAITRAKEKCFITHARQRMLFGRTEYGSPSKFLSELDEACLERKTLEAQRQGFFHRRKKGPQPANTGFVPKNRKEALWGIPENTSDYAIGNRIRHAEFGEGTVISISGDVLSVAFSGQGVKKIVSSVAPIELLGE